MSSRSAARIPMRAALSAYAGPIPRPVVPRAFAPLAASDSPSIST